MLCPNCQSEFNQTSSLPRILIFCGHTFCHSCIEHLLSECNSPEGTPKSFPCPDCSTVNQAMNGIDSFPKNLVLLQVNNNIQQQQNQQQQREHEDIHREREQQSYNQEGAKQSARQSNAHGFKQVCPQHHKKLEAFCEKDLHPLCIDCILSEAHKSHEIVSVQKAVERQKQYLFDEVTGAQRTEERLKGIQSDIKRHIGDMHSQAERNRRELSQIYAYVRELLLDREQTLKRQISENLQREEQESQTRLLEVGEFMSKIGGLKSELIAQSQESEIEMLQKARYRQGYCQEVNGPRSKDLSSISIIHMANSSQSLSEIKREQELMQISKLVNPTSKGNQAALLQMQNQQQNCPQGSTLYSHTMASKMKRAGNSTVNANGAPPALQNINTSGPILQKEPSLKESIPLEKRLLEEGRKSNNAKTTNTIKSKVSPHRAQTAKKLDQQATLVNKQKGVVVLDQNKKIGVQNTKTKGASQGHFNGIVQQHINLYNHQQSTNDQDNSEDICLNGGGMAADDVSSIYPLETNDCYFQYSPRGNLLKTNVINNPELQAHLIKRDESVGALNDLLDSLNKSGGHFLPCHNRESSTASETANSNSDPHILPPPHMPSSQGMEKSKSGIETPKRKVNPWIRQKSSSNKKLTSSNGDDFEEFKTQVVAASTRTPSKKPFENTSLHRSGSLQRYNTNSLAQQNNEYGVNEHQTQENKRQGMLNLSQERNKRKQRKNQQPTVESPSKYNSPKKNQEANGSLMVMLQECTKNIEKLEFKHPSAKKKQFQLELNIHQEVVGESPNRVSASKANVCLVDLTNRDDSANGVEQVHRKVSEDEAPQIPISHTMPDEEETKNNCSKEGELSESCSSPIKDHHQTGESFDERPLINQFSKSSQDCLSSKNTGQMVSTFQQQSTSSISTLQQSQTISNLDTSTVTSTTDPFRALCRVKEEFIFVFSGFNDQKLMMCEGLDVQRGVWKEISQIGKARTKFAAVPISKSRILLFGGKLADGQRTGEIEEYNLKTNKFKTLPFKLPKPRSGFSACVKREEGKIFFCGGNSGQVLKKFDCLDLKKGKWSRWPEMLHKRDELAVALGPDGKVYAIGGYGGSNTPVSAGSDDTQEKTPTAASNCLRTAERFDFNTGQWEMLPEMNEARRALAAVALPDGIYAIGGYDGKQYLSSVEKFDLQKQQWIPVKSMNTSRCTLSAVASTDCQYIYALGGFNGNSLDLVERYNIMTDEWEFMTPMNSKRFMHEAVCLITH